MKGEHRPVELSVATCILRGYCYEQVREVVRVLTHAQFVKNIEVTLNTKDALDTISKISHEFSDELTIGAGTVLSLEDAQQAYTSGAQFILSPDMINESMIEFCRAHEVLTVPGAFTPSEIRECYRRGCDVVKVFPAQELSYSYAHKVCEPLGNLPLMAVGGVNARTIGEVLAGGYHYVGSAGGIFSPQDIKNGTTEHLQAQLETFEMTLATSLETHS